MENRKYKTIIADDHSIVVEGLKHILSKNSRIEVVGTAFTGQQALELAEAVRPELVILDIKMPILDGIRVGDILHGKMPATRLIALSSGFTLETFQKAMQAGFVGFVDKESDFSEINRAVDEVLAGHSYHCRKVRHLMAESLRGSAENKGEKLFVPPAEKELIVLLTEGLTINQIALKFGKSPKTVDAQKRKMMQRLGVNNLAELTKFAIQNGLISLDTIAC